MRPAAYERDDEIRPETRVQPRRSAVSGARDSLNSAPRMRRMLPDNPVWRIEDCRCDTCNLAGAKALAGTRDASDAKPARDPESAQTASRRTSMALTGRCIQVRWMACARGRLTLLFTGTRKQKTKSRFWVVVIVGTQVVTARRLYISRAKDKLSLSFAKVI